MKLTAKYRWFGTALLVGLLYIIVGTLFPNPSVSDPMQFVWRLAAWIISAVTFVFRILYEHFRLHNSTRRVALHTSTAVALGAFGLAVAANIHSLQAGTGNRQLLVLALLIWPVMSAVPAFVVAIAAEFGLTRIRQNDKPKRE